MNLSAWWSAICNGFSSRSREAWVCRLCDHPSGEEVFQWALYDANAQRQGAIQAGSISELVRAVAQYPAALHVAVPGRHVRSGYVALPLRHRRQRLKALPFAVEETVAGEMEELHLAPGDYHAERGQAYALVSHEMIGAWRDLLAEITAPIKSMAPLYAWLQRPGANLLRQINSDEWMYAPEKGAGMAIQRSLLEPFLSQCVAMEMSLNVVSAGSEDVSTTALVQKYGLEPVSSTVPLLDSLAEGALHYPSINLLQGKYAQLGSAAASTLATWCYPVAALLLLATFPLGWDAWILHQGAVELAENAKSTYSAWFPGDKRIVNIPVQVVGHLAQNEQRANGVDVLVLLSALAQAVDEVQLGQAYPLQSLSFISAKSELRVELLLSSMPQLENLRAAIERQHLGATVESATTEKEKVRAIIRLGGAL